MGKNIFMWMYSEKQDARKDKSCEIHVGSFFHLSVDLNKMLLSIVIFKGKFKLIVIIYRQKTHGYSISGPFFSGPSYLSKMNGFS